MLPVHQVHVLNGEGNQRVSHIIHVADLHVRIGARNDEYRHIFDAFCNEIESLPSVKNNSAILVIAGDLFHTRRVDSGAGKCIFELFNRLLRVLPIFIICGNHDYQQGHNETTDMIELLTTPYAYTHAPLHYLNVTGHYVYKNIVFGVTRVQDTLRACNTSGIVTDLAPFPSPAALNTQHKIALFHGTISQSALPSGRSADSVAKGYPLDWFQGYDLVLLGDNHKQQIHSTPEGMKWGYPGSLIQQDHGEPLDGHGYIIWDLDARTGVAHHIHNPYGALTIVKSNECFSAVLDTRTSTPLSDVLTSLPKWPRLRVVGTYANSTEVTAILASAGITPSEIRISNPKAVLFQTPTSTSVVVPESEITLAHLNQPVEWAAYITSKDADISTEWIRNPHSLLVPPSLLSNVSDTLSASISTRNSKLSTLINAYDAELQRSATTNHAVVLQYIEFQYLLCYGKNNWFDFTNVDGRIALLNGENAVGKTSFMDVVCTALFGEPTSSRRDFSGDSMAVKIIHDGKPHGESAFVLIHLLVDNAPFEIYRTFTYAGADERRVDNVLAKAVIYSLGGQGGKEVIAEGTTMVDRWVTRHIGTAQETLMSAMLSQQDHSNFFFQSAAQQRAIIERALHMDTITAYESALDEAVRVHKYILDQVAQYHKGLCDVPVGGDEGHDYSAEAEAEAEEHVNRLTLKMHSLLSQCGAMNYEQIHDAQVEKVLATAEETRAHMGHVDEREVLTRKGALDHRQRHMVAPKQFTSLNQATQWLKTTEKPAPAPEPTFQLASSDIEAALEASSYLNEIGLDDSTPPSHTDTISTTELLARKDQATASVHTITISLQSLQHVLTQIPLNAPTSQKRRSRAKPMTRDALIHIANTISSIHPSRPDSDAVAKGFWKARLAEWQVKRPTQPIDAMKMELDDLVCAENLSQQLNDPEFNNSCEACHDRRARIIRELEGRQPNTERRNELKTLLDHAHYYESQRPEMEHEMTLWATAHRHTLLLSRLHNERERIAEQVDLLKSQQITLLAAEDDAIVALKHRWAAVRKCLAWRAYAEWTEAHRAVEWFQLEADRKELEEPLRCLELDATIAKCRQIMAQQRLQIVRTELASASADARRLHETRVRNAAASAAAHARDAKLQNVLAAMNELQTRLDKLRLLHARFVGDKANDGFKMFVYRDKVLPLIQDVVNEFLQTLNSIRLKIRIKNNKFIFLLEDRGSTPTLDHASGYQKFIVNLGMRVALSRIGAVGQNLKHLFLDEGFVACDAENLRKTAGLLREIMTFGGYTSLILMSHLETIRDAAEVHVTITRNEDNTSSLLRWGERRTPIPKAATAAIATVAKSGGRPRKNI